MLRELVTAARLCFRPSRGSPPGKMAALRTTPGSPATQLAKVEDGLECGPAQEEEEEEDQGEEVEIEEEEEIVVEEGEDKQVVEDEEDGGRAGHVDQVEVELEEDEDVEEVTAEEQSLTLGTQERCSRAADAKSPVLQGKGKRKEPAPGVGGSGGLGGQARTGWSWSIRTQVLKRRSLELLPLLAVRAKVTMAARPDGEGGPLTGLPLSLAGRPGSSHA